MRREASSLVHVLPVCVCFFFFEVYPTTLSSCRQRSPPARAQYRRRTANTPYLVACNSSLPEMSVTSADVKYSE